MEWAALASAKNLEAAQSASNILMVLYAISYFLNRKAVFITAFLLFEFCGNSSVFSALTDAQYYLMYAIVSCFCYWCVFYQFKSIKICSGYAILVLLELTMSYNELTRPEVETFIYTYYEYIVMVVHIYIISTITRISSLSGFVRDFFACVRNKLSASYSVSFFWYTLLNIHKKDTC